MTIHLDVRDDAVARRELRTRLNDLETWFATNWTIRCAFSDSRTLSILDGSIAATMLATEHAEVFPHFCRWFAIRYMRIARSFAMKS
jgi:hypothetical protein